MANFPSTLPLHPHLPLLRSALLCLLAFGFSRGCIFLALLQQTEKFLLLKMPTSLSLRPALSLAAPSHSHQGLKSIAAECICEFRKKQNNPEALIHQNVLQC